MNNEMLKQAWEKRDGAVVLTTVDSDGMPNSIYATCVGLSSDNRIVIADNYFYKTKQNIEAKSKVTVLFITLEGKSYQVKGEMEYHSSGEMFTWMKSWNPTKHPGHGALVINATHLYSGKEKLS
ncbi:MAG: pyridoxamine 5'-phosphate oxidase family protein [Spirochaetia bacterium]|nr:pyridoxamine 5'-phosphate oxidase family protein [Spirochaetia bacterium]